MVWYGMAWYGMVWHGVVWYGMVHGMAWHGMVVWYGGMGWHGMAWHGMAWHGMVSTSVGNDSCCPTSGFLDGPPIKVMPVVLPSQLQDGEEMPKIRALDCMPGSNVFMVGTKGCDIFEARQLAPLLPAPVPMPYAPSQLCPILPVP